MIRTSFALAAALLTATSIRAQHFDILAARDLTGTRLVSGSADLGASTFTVGPRVFAADFVGTATDEPGYNAVAAPTGGLALPGSAALNFDFKAMTIGASTSNLMYWNGVGGVNFAPVVGGQTLSATLGGSSATVTGTAADVTGFTINTTGAAGTLHQHMDGFSLGGGSTPDGIYLVGQQFRMTGLANSDTFYLVFNKGMTEAVHDSASTWVTDNLAPVPEPAGLFALAAGAALGLRRVVRGRRGPDTKPVG